MNRLSTAVLVVVAGLAILLATNRFHAASAAIALPDPAVDETLALKKGHATVVIAGGCFWGVQAVFEHVKGVKRATSGYAGGTLTNPDYEAVSSGATGHAESVEVEYDPSQITLGGLLKVFFSVAHDPTELNRQGPDSGTQYRSAIFPTNPEQARIAAAYIAQLDQAHVFAVPIVTKIEDGKQFYPAEAYHQDYLTRHPTQPYIAINDLPKIDELKRLLPSLYRADPVLVAAASPAR